MSSRRAPGQIISTQQGFTLLEMLLVISLLAAVSFVATTAYRGVLGNSNQQLVFTEMKEIATAIQRFKQDTGYYPKEGPFGLVGVGLGTITDAQIQSHLHAGADLAARARWFNSPANFYQLLSNPLNGTGHPLEHWNPENGRGWRGPYLAGFTEGHVDIGDGINGIIYPAGNPLVPLVANIPDIDGLADPFVYPGVPVTDASVDNSLLDWSRTPRPNRTEIDKSGRPYLFFAAQRLLVSMGPDGVYGPHNGINDDITLNIE